MTTKWNATRLREVNVPDEFNEWLDKCPEQFTPMRTDATYGKAHYETLTYTFYFPEQEDKYIVWVGASDDHYDSYDEAKEAYDEWIEKGYDDVIIEQITQ